MAAFLTLCVKGAVADIINALDCSADELLCLEIGKARPLLDSRLSELAADGDADKIKMMNDMVISLKASLRRLGLTGR